MTAPTRARQHWIDAVKAAAIVAVVATHSGRVNWSGVGRSIWDFPLTSAWVRFQVPAFLLVSGILYARGHPVSFREMGRRLERLLVPFLIASGVAQVLVVQPESWQDVLYKLITASTFNIYYYIAILAQCMLATWVLSRMSQRAVLVVWLGLVGLLVFEASGAWKSLSVSPFWFARISLYRFSLGLFVTGWLIGRSAPGLIAGCQQRKVLVLGPALCLAAICIAAFSGWIPIPNLISRTLYTFSVVSLIAVWNGNRPVPGWVVFLSETSLMIYLYHMVFQRLLFPSMDSWPDLLRILGQAGIGLGGAILLGLLGRKLLGKARARRYLGA